MKANDFIVATVLAALLALGSPLAAVAESEGVAAFSSSVVLQPDNWEYGAVKKLQSAGIMPNFRLTPHTREEFAETLLPLARLAAVGTIADASARRDLEQKLRSNPGTVDALVMLMEEFNPVLEKRRLNMATAMLWLADMEPNAEVPAMDGAYPLIDSLDKAGIVLGLPDGYGERREFTRSQIAVEIARLMPFLTSDAAYGTWWRLDTWWREDLHDILLRDVDAVDALQELIEEFRPEIQPLDPNVDAATDRLNALEPRADVPDYDPAYQWCDMLERAGIVIGFPDGTYGGKRAMTRPQFAVAINRLIQLLTSEFPADVNKQEYTLAQQDIEQKLAPNPNVDDAFLGLMQEFRPELQKLDANVPAARERLDALKFAGVPSSHWAFQAIGALKKAGIIVGYPNGTYCDRSK